MSNLHSINKEQGLYVLECGAGYSCLGFHVAERLRVAVLEWLGRGQAPYPEIGTQEHYAAYCEAMAQGAAHNRATGERCPAELSPALKGLEGKRVEVAYPDGEGGIYRTRFWVGRSTGWLPIHLEIKTGRSSGGCGAHVPKNATVRVVV